MGSARDAAWRKFGRRWWKAIIGWDVARGVGRVLLPVVGLLVAMGALVAGWRWASSHGPGAAPDVAPTMLPPTGSPAPPVSAAAHGGEAGAGPWETVATWVGALPIGLWFLVAAAAGWFALRPWPVARGIFVGLSTVAGLTLLCAAGLLALLP